MKEDTRVKVAFCAGIVVMLDFAFTCRLCDAYNDPSLLNGVDIGFVFFLYLLSLALGAVLTVYSLLD